MTIDTFDNAVNASKLIDSAQTQISNIFTSLGTSSLVVATTLSNLTTKIGGLEDQVSATGDTNSPEAMANFTAEETKSALATQAFNLVIKLQKADKDLVIAAAR